MLDLETGYYRFRYMRPPAPYKGVITSDGGGGDDVLQITGGTNTPARFDFGDGFFIGPRIQIRPSDNYVWINEAGEFRIPTAALPAGLPDQPNQSWFFTYPSYIWAVTYINC